jgi:hypothetical protein
VTGTARIAAAAGGSSHENFGQCRICGQIPAEAAARPLIRQCPRPRREPKERRSLRAPCVVWGCLLISTLGSANTIDEFLRRSEPLTATGYLGSDRYQGRDLGAFRSGVEYFAAPHRFLGASADQTVCGCLWSSWEVALLPNGKFEDRAVWTSPKRADCEYRVYVARRRGCRSITDS